MVRSNERPAEIQMSMSYVLRDGGTIIMDEMARATEPGVNRALTTTFASALVETYRLQTLKLFLELMR